MDSKEYLLYTAVRHFSKYNFDEVSIRDIAKSAKVANHTARYFFPTKHRLYLQAMKFSFAKQTSSFEFIWQSNLSAEEKLGRYVRCLVEAFSSDIYFRKFMQRELCEANDQRLKLLANQVFKEQFSHLMVVVQQLAPSQSVHFSAISIIALVCNIIQMQALSRYLPGWQPKHENIDFITEQVVGLIMGGVGNNFSFSAAENEGNKAQ